MSTDETMIVLLSIYVFISMAVAIWDAANRRSWFMNTNTAPDATTAVYGLLLAFVAGSFWPVSLVIWFFRKKEPEPITALIGENGRVTKDLVPVGKVTVGGIEYEARAETGTLALNHEVTVIDVRIGQVNVQKLPPSSS